MAHETERYSLHLPRDFWPLVDAWRRLQPDLPTRAEAVRRLVAAGINLSGFIVVQNLKGSLSIGDVLAGSLWPSGSTIAALAVKAEPPKEPTP